MRTLHSHPSVRLVFKFSFLILILSYSIASVDEWCFPLSQALMCSLGIVIVRVGYHLFPEIILKSGKMLIFPKSSVNHGTQGKIFFLKLIHLLFVCLIQLFGFGLFPPPSSLPYPLFSSPGSQCVSFLDFPKSVMFPLKCLPTMQDAVIVLWVHSYILGS